MRPNWCTVGSAAGMPTGNPGAVLNAPALGSNANVHDATRSRWVPAQPCHHSPSSRAKPTLSALNSGRCKNITMPLCPPTSSSVGRKLPWVKASSTPPPRFHASLVPLAIPRTARPRAGGAQNLDRLAGSSHVQDEGSHTASTQPTPFPGRALTRHKAQVDGAGKALPLCLQPSDGLKVPAGDARWWFEGAGCAGSGADSPESSRAPGPHSLDGDALHVLGTPGIDVALGILNSLEGRVGPVLLWEHRPSPHATRLPLRPAPPAPYLENWHNVSVGVEQDGAQAGICARPGEDQHHAALTHL